MIKKIGCIILFNTAFVHQLHEIIFINFPKLLSVYIGVYSDEDRQHIEQIASKFKVKIRIFDAKTVDIWGRK